MSTFKQILAWIGGILAVLALASVIKFFAFGSFALFAPLYEGVRRDVMIESRYYSEATVRELYRLRRQYDSAKSDAAKTTIAATARHEFEIFDKDRLPADLRSWMFQLQR